MTALEEDAEPGVMEEDQGKKAEVDHKAMVFPTSNEWSAWEKVFKHREGQKNQKFREGSVPSLVGAALHPAGLPVSRGYGWFALYLEAALNVGTAEQGETSLALDPLYANISCLEKNSQRSAFLVKLELLFKGGFLF